MKHTCLVCGFPGMEDAPANHEICPCCGTQFDLDDVERTHEQLRKAWIAGGMKWFSRTNRPPRDWSAKKQLASLELKKAR